MYIFLSEYHYLATRKPNKRIYPAISDWGVRMLESLFLSVVKLKEIGRNLKKILKFTEINFSKLFQHKKTFIPAYVDALYEFSTNSVKIPINCHQNRREKQRI